jgi:polysaccharide biosynthesis protein PslH
MKILYLSQRIPYPPDRGDRIATFHQIRHLSRRHEVVVGSLGVHSSPGDKNEFVRSLGVQLIAPDHARLPRLINLISSLLAGKPLTLGYFYNRALRKSLECLVDRGHFDAIVIFSSSMAQYVEKMGHITRIMNFCDVDSQKWLALSERRHGPMRWIYRREARTLLEYEQKIAREFAVSCVVTQREADIFHQLIPEIPVHIVENGVDIDHFSGFPRRPNGLKLVFVGVMDYAPNVEAVTYFAEQVWPQIIKAHPQARFIIVGSRPVRTVRKLSERQGIEVTGQVPDIRPYLSTATLFVAPLKVARGVQNKVLEAMAASLPVLTTPVVAQGLPSRAEDYIFLAERESTSWVSAVLALIANSKSREERAASANDYIRRFCSWDCKLEKLDSLLKATLCNQSYLRPHGVNGEYKVPELSNINGN